MLIKDTTRAQREEIVRRALCDGGCDGCSGCGNLGGGRVEEMYRPYIEGKKELRDNSSLAENGIWDGAFLTMKSGG